MSASNGNLPRSNNIPGRPWFAWVWFALLVTTVQLVAVPKPDESKPAAEAKSPWTRIVVIGASVSAGFTETEPLGGPMTEPLRLNYYLDAALGVAHEPAQNFATPLFFMQPEPAGRNQIDEAIAAHPTLVVGIDFLFWFCYGSEARTDAERLKRFELGLKFLESIPCPLIVGDLPDAAAAVGETLQPDQYPGLTVIAAANRRLKAWAAARPQVTVVPLAKFLRQALANQPLTIHGHTLDQDKTRALLQGDKLHPTPLGSATLAVSILDAFLSARPNLSSVGVRLDPKEVFRLGYQLAQAPPQPAPSKPASGN